MNKKDQYRRAYSLIRYEAVDQDYDYLPRNFRGRYVADELATIDNDALGAALRAHLLDWYTSRPGAHDRPGKYLKMQQDRAWKRDHSYVLIPKHVMERSILVPKEDQVDD